MTDYPTDHLSASQITSFMRCPRTYQEKYIFGNPGPSNSSLVIGSAVHEMLSHTLNTDLIPQSWDTVWREILDETYMNGEIVWKDSPEYSEKIARKMFDDYMEKVGRFLQPVGTEIEISLEIPGIPIPVVGFIDLETEDKAVDYKTTGYFNRKVALNPEWKLQANIYQLHHQKPAEFHVLTRSKTDPVVIPNHPGHELYIPVPNRRDTELFLRQQWDVMKFYWDRFGHDEFPGNVIHPWAGKYCQVANCCQRG